MVRYEALILAVPEITQDEIKQLESHIANLVSKVQGNVISFERWGKYRLAYPVKRNDYGVYFLTRFEMDKSQASLLKDLQVLFAVKLNDIIMRTMIDVLDPKASLQYQRPHSLEEAPPKEAGSFMREGKMDGWDRDRERGGYHRDGGRRGARHDQSFEQEINEREEA